jgi:hypothetical protein
MKVTGEQVNLVTLGEEPSSQIRTGALCTATGLRVSINNKRNFHESRAWQAWSTSSTSIHFIQ